MTTGDPHEHARPGLADMRASLAVARAILLGDDPGAAHRYASAAPCPACVAVASASLGINVAEQLAAELTAKLAPGAVLDVGPIRAAILGVIASAEAELRAAGN